MAQEALNLFVIYLLLIGLDSNDVPDWPRTTRERGTLFVVMGLVLLIWSSSGWGVRRRSKHRHANALIVRFLSALKDGVACERRE